MSQQAELNFSGPSLTPADRKRLGHQLVLVREHVVGQGWMTLRMIAQRTGAPEASVSARLRDLRKLGLCVERRRAAEGSGLWLYRVTEVKA